MKEYQQKQEIKRRAYSKITLLVLLILLLLILKGVWGIYLKERESGLEMNRAKSAQADIEARYNVLKASVDDITSEHGMDREIRSKFNVVKPGEGLIVVVDKEISPAIDQKPTVLDKIWKSVKGVFNKKQ